MGATPILGIPTIETQQAQPEITHNEAVYLLQLALMGAISLGDNAPPGSPAEGDVYVLGSAPTGAWTGKANKIAIRFNGAWRFLPGNDASGTNIPIGADQAGLTIFNRDDGLLYYWTGSAWQIFTGAVEDFTDLGDVPGSYAGAGEEFVRVNAGATGLEFVALGDAAFEDYEEGTFTPSLTFATPGDLSVSYTLQVGNYRRIGSLVFFSVRLACTPTFTTASGQLRVSGNPFIAATDNVFNVGAAGGVGLIEPAGTVSYFHQTNSGNDFSSIAARGTSVNRSLNSGDITSGSEFILSASGFFYV